MDVKRSGFRIRYSVTALFFGVACFLLAQSLANNGDVGGGVLAPGDYLHNLTRVDDDVINGSAPEGDAGFDALSAMGVKTIVCVDGAAPDVERAAARGMHYVHLPIGYDGVDPAMGRKLAKALRDLPRPIYVHCFHGKHRSPAAAAYAMVALEKMAPQEGVALMRKIGTSEHYVGLYAAVANAKPIDPDRLNALPDDFPARAVVSGIVSNMADLGRTWDDLKAIRLNDWQPAETHPDLTAAHETEILANVLADLEKSEDVPTSPEFHKLLKQAQAAANDLAASLAKEPTTDADKDFATLEQSCRTCRTRFRD